jgi:hypothetical protein
LAEERRVETLPVELYERGSSVGAACERGPEIFPAWVGAGLEARSVTLFGLDHYQNTRKYSNFVSTPFLLLKLLFPDVFSQNLEFMKFMKTGLMSL